MTAKRLLLELGGKLGDAIAVPTSVVAGAQADILQALLALGYKTATLLLPSRRCRRRLRSAKASGSRCASSASEDARGSYTACMRKAG